MSESIKESPYDFGITEGRRDSARQQQLVKEGKSRTLNSRHLTGHAVDIAVFIDGKLTWDFDKYKSVAEHVKKIAASLSVPIVWGGDWRGLVDGPHFELNRNDYPA
jgi:peptidoglycan L-alanyl-D-glutamate endopeptidase CwlK